MTVGIETPGLRAPEARFTGPTDLCPHPELWFSTDGDSTECEVSELAYGLVRALQPGVVIETGTGFGQTAYDITRALERNAHGVLYTIEPDAERVEYCHNQVSRWTRSSHATLVEGSSLDWIPPAGSVIEFAWLDSFYELRVPEFWHFHPYMRAGTTVCFHDTAPEHGSHRIASGRDLRSEIEHELADVLDVVHLPTPRGVTIGVVR